MSAPERGSALPDVLADIRAWCTEDRRRALLPREQRIIEDSVAIRVWLAQAVKSGLEDEVYDAALALGRHLGRAGGSPTLASLTIDGAASALARETHPALAPAGWLAGARAAVAEGYAAARQEAQAALAMVAWDYPDCAVPLAGGTVALAAGAPHDDREALDAWASRVARGVLRDGARRAFVAGTGEACGALAEALALVGVEVARLTPRQDGSRT